MSKKLFVGGLAWGTTEEGLRDAFANFGELAEVKIITDRETGRSRGFGFVSFADGASAEKAMTELNGTDLDGRTIRVDMAREQQRRGGPPRGGRRDERF
ncbi:MAG: RNA-binding protein [Myxococcales bacterium]|nr:RNA-binding protein [Myxococcales bacterium]